MSPWTLLAAATDSASEAAPDEWSQGALITLSLGLLLVAFMLIVLEFFVISGGIFSAGAAILGVSAIVVAFRVHPVMGGVMAGVSPILALIIVRWGLRRLQGSSLVTQATIGGDAGYHHYASEQGISVGAEGTMVTNAMPTGRCRFTGGEADVAIEGGSARKGDLVTVLRIDGPTIVVSRAKPNAKDFAPPA